MSETHAQPRPGPGGPWNAHTLVFISGLHRSGTTQLHATMASHPEVGALLGTSAPHDEGQHLQDVYPTARRHGGPGRFALDPRSHLTEESPLVSQASARRLFEQWSRVWPLDRRVLIEKSPPNLIRMRFLQALYPEARFVVIVRHPVTVALATQKLATSWWMRRVGRRAPIEATLAHWVAAHRLMLEDLPQVEHRHLLRWEDLCRDPSAQMAAVAAFVGIEPRFEPLELAPTADDRYAAQWRALFRDPAQRRALAPALERGREVAGRFGYRIDDPTIIGPSSV